jgi:N,N'-diacetyllegionaminate synthase
MMISIIAEIGINHDGNVSKAFDLIEAAKKCGADIVKFQMHLPDEQMLPDTKAADYVEGSIYDLLSKVSLSYNDFLKIRKCCDKNEIEFIN